MSSETRRRLRERHQGHLNRWWTSLATQQVSDELAEEDRLESARRRNWLAAARSYDPEAGLDEELVVHLEGPAATNGSLTLSVGDVLLKPLQDTVSSAAAAGGSSESTLALEIFALSHGSTVLHVRPTRNQRSAPISDDVPTDATPTEQAMNAVVRAVRAAETSSDVRAWTSMLDPLQKLSTVLDELNLDMGLAWHAVSGETRSARLSSVGRNYLRSLDAVEPKRTERTVHGRVTELRESGLVKLKTAAYQTAPVHEVRFEPGALVGLRLSLGETVSVLVEDVREIDAVGRTRKHRLTFMELLTREEPLDGSQDA